MKCVLMVECLELFGESVENNMIQKMDEKIIVKGNFQTQLK